MVNWDEIRREFESSNISLKELADKYGVKDSTLRSRKNRENWQRNGSATQRKNVATKKRGAPVGNSNGKGNRGNKQASPPERNSNALKHGLFSRYMPKETLEIMSMVAGSNPADLIWMQIELQFAAIIRAQEIMFVRDKDDMTREIKKTAVADGLDSTEWDIQYAWDKQATFLNAQTRAINELRTAIKQFVEMADANDERRLKLEQMRIAIDKTKAEVEKLSGDNDDSPIQILIKRKGED